jgi:hypothetical protein
MLMRGGTKRDETRPTDGAIVARTAEMLGKPLLPWQRYVADVAGEIDLPPERTITTVWYFPLRASAARAR